MSPRPAASAVATPPAMFAPARLWTSFVPVRPRIAATIAAVVVLPLVAETTTLPSRQAGGEPRDGVRLGAHQHLPGQRGPAAAGQARDGARRAGGEQPRLQPHGSDHPQRAGPDAHRGGQVGDRVAVGVGGERAVGVEGDLAALHELEPGLPDMGALEHAVESAQVLELRLVLRERDVEQAVLDARVRHQPHPAAEHARVGHGHGVPVELVLGAVDGDVPARGLPAGERAERRRRGRRACRAGGACRSRSR